MTRDEILSRIVESIKNRLDELDAVRNEAIKLSREVIRLSGWSITEIHKGDKDKAVTYLEECRKATVKLLNMVEPYPELYYSGFVYNAVSEYVEAELFYRIISNNNIPGPRELGVPDVPYLQGLGDVVGELRRHILDLLSRRRIADAEELLGWMDSISRELKALDYPDAMVPGVRRKTDVARRLVEETKALLVDLKTRYELIDKLDCSDGAR